MNYQHTFIDGRHNALPVGKVVCIGRNYAAHVKELNNPMPTTPLIFMKPSSAIVGHEPSFSLPKDQGTIHYEVEIAVLIGRRLQGLVTETAVNNAIIGLAPALDLTLRDLQTELKAQGYPWERAKAFDGACVLAPFCPYDTEIDLANINIGLAINGATKQAGNSAAMMLPIIPFIQYCAQFFTLNPGDVILTGTPEGVGPLNSGDTLTLELNKHKFATQVL